MKSPETKATQTGFSALDLLVVVVLLLVLGAVFVSRLPRDHVGASRISCVNNLKQIGLAFKTWELDNGMRYPMAVPPSEGGSRRHTRHQRDFGHRDK